MKRARLTIVLALAACGGSSGNSGAQGLGDPSVVPGPTGRTGATGATGPAGITGAMGAAGVMGATGAAGPAGSNPFLTSDFILYVDGTAGSDSNPGTQALPLKTVDAALDQVPAEWGKKARIYVAAGYYDMPVGKTWVIGNGLGAASEPLLIQGAMTTVSSRNITGLAAAPTRTNEFTVDGPAMTAGQYRGHFVFGAGGPSGNALPTVVQILDNTASTIVLSELVNAGAITIQKPAALIGFGASNTGLTIIPTIRGAGNGRTLVELWGVELTLRSADDAVEDFNFENLSLYFNGSWIFGGQGSTNFFRDVTLTAGTSHQIADINALFSGNGATTGMYHDYPNGPGAYFDGCDQLFFDGPTTAIEPGFLFINGDGDSTFMFVQNGARATMGWLNALSANFWVLSNSTMRILPGIDGGGFGIPLIDNDGQQGFQVASGSLLEIAGVVFQNASPAIVVTEGSKVILGVSPAEAGSGGVVPTGATGSYGVSLSGFSYCILTGTSGLTLTNKGYAPPVGSGVFIDGVAASWAAVEAATQMNNGSGASYQPN